MKHLAHIFIGFFLFLGLGTMAQDGFRSFVSKNPVQVGERFKITFELQNMDGEITPPPMTDFRIVFGPSTSSNYSYVNGKASKSKSLSYTVIAEQAGNFTVAAASAKTSKGVLKSKPLTVKVVQGQSNSNATTQSKGGTNQKKVSTTGDIIIQAEVSNRTPYVGEGVVVKYILYSRYQSLELGEASYPTWNGFWVKNDKPEKVSWDSELTTINGMRYRSVLLDRQVIYPQKAGKINIDPMELQVFVNRSFFNPGTAFDLVSNKINFNVKALPSNAPAGFTGNTGTYSLTSSITPRDSAKVNEPVTLKIRVKGTGNLDLVSKPSLRFPGDFEVYDPKISKRYSTKNGKTSGYVEFEYLMIPRFAGDYSIEPYTFSYFDPSKKKYQTNTAQFPVIHVTGDNKGSNFAATGSGLVDRKNVELLSEDIKYIVTGDYVAKQKSFNAKNIWFNLLCFSPILAFILGFFLNRKRSNYLSNTDLVLKDKSYKAIKQHLGAAKKSLNEQSDDFYQKIEEAFESFLVGFFKMEKGSIKKSNIQDTLTNKGVDATQIASLLSILDDCQMARFASFSQADRAGLFEKSQELMKNLMQKVK